MAEVVVAIHQPNFLPWLGFFHRMAACDIFVVLDNVQFSRGTRTNRVQVLAGDKAHWLTVPVRREGMPLIRDARIDDSRPWRDKAVRTLHTSYGGRPGFEETAALVEPLLLDPTERLAELNENGIRALADALAVRPAIVRASSIDVDGSSSELLAQLVAAAGGTVYLSGAGAEAYLVDEPFARLGIRVEVQRFVEPDHPQGTPEPVRGLSVVDGMMHIGIERMAEQLRVDRAVGPVSSAAGPEGRHAP